MWLKKKIRKWVNQAEAHELERENSIHYGNIAVCDDSLDASPIRFKVYRASGGTVVETNFYDRKTDRQSNSLHVIVEGQDLGHEIGKIITVESLKL